MNTTDSEASANHVYSILLQDKALELKTLLKDIQNDYDNPSCDYVLRKCTNAKDLENFLKDYAHLFILDNNKVARYNEKLEIGQEIADRYFEEKLKQNNNYITFEEFRKHVEDSPEDIRHFMQTFYPKTELKRYLHRRPHIFYVSDQHIVSLTEKECAVFFRKIVKEGQGISFTSLRGNVGQAPKHIRNYINTQYPGTEFRFFLENNCDVFKLNSTGRVFLFK